MGGPPVSTDLVVLSQELQSRVDQLADTKTQRDRLDRIRSVTETLTSARTTLSSQVELIAEIAKDQALTAKDVPRFRAEAIERLVQTVLEDLPKAVDDLNVTKVADHLQGLTQELRGLVERRWAVAAEQVHLSDVKGLLQALAQVDRFSERAKELLAIVQSLESTLEGGQVPDAARYRIFRKDVSDLLAAVAELKISDKPGLEDFLKDAAAGHATLARLTPAINDWISEEGLQDHFLVRPGRPRD